MSLSIFTALFITLITSVVISNELPKSPELRWKLQPETLKRGRSDLHFNLVNLTSIVYTTNSWVPQFGRNDFPNVLIFAAPVDSGNEVYSFNPVAQIGQIPQAVKEIPPSETEPIVADVLISVPEGEYIVWAELRCDRRIKTKKIPIRVSGGGIVLPDRK
jgi:hypothetical protein